MRRSRGRALLLAFLLAGCGASPASRVNLFDQGELEAARERVPDLVAAAEGAAQDANQAREQGDAEAAEDHETRARLLFEAAVVEAERLELDEQRLALEQETEEVTRELLAIQEQRAELGEQIARDRAAEIAREEAARALQRAEEDEPRRHRARSEELAAARREAARALAQRALLVLAAARSLGAEENDLQAVVTLARAAPGEPLPRVAMAKANEAHRRALALLGQARTAHPVSDESRASFVEAASERRFEVDIRDGGLALFNLPSRLPAGRMEAIVELALAHPHGPVQVRGNAQQQAALSAALKAGGVPEERIQAGSAPTFEVLFPAYGRSD